MGKVRFYLAHAGLFLLFMVLISAAAMLLWNALIPAIFSLPAITFLQAAGLLILSRLILGGFGHMWDHIAHSDPEARRFHRIWHQMTKEQKKEFVKSRWQFFRDGRGGEGGRAPHMSAHTENAEKTSHNN